MCAEQRICEPRRELVGGHNTHTRAATLGITRDGMESFIYQWNSILQVHNDNSTVTCSRIGGDWRDFLKEQTTSLAEPQIQLHFQARPKLCQSHERAYLWVHNFSIDLPLVQRRLAGLRKRDRRIRECDRRATQSLRRFQYSMNSTFK